MAAYGLETDDGYNAGKTANAVLTIDRSAISKNIQILGSHLVSEKCEIAAVMKADAYGLGLGNVLSVFQSHGTKTYFMATPAEAVTLRQLLGPRGSIYVLGGFWKDCLNLYREYNLNPVLNSLPEIEFFVQINKENPRNPLRAAIHFDTGMNRLGLDNEETEIFIEHYQDHPVILNGITMMLSHYACADEPEHALNHEQQAAFSRLGKFFPWLPKSLCNSFGIFLDTNYHYDLVRPGMAVYGLNPFPHKPSPIHPVISLHARLLQVRKAKKGQTVGYGATCTVEKDRLLGTVALGYADGYLRSLSNKGCLYWKGHAVPVTGRVSMDLVTVDLDALPANINRPVPGDFIEIIGKNRTADDLADAAGTIGYEILTSLGSRYRRRVI